MLHSSRKWPLQAPDGSAGICPFLISFFFFGKISVIMFQLQGLTLLFDRDDPPLPNLLRGGGNPAKHARPFVISA